MISYKIHGGQWKVITVRVAVTSPNNINNQHFRLLPANKNKNFVISNP